MGDTLTAVGKGEIWGKEDKGKRKKERKKGGSLKYKYNCVLSQ